MINVRPLSRTIRVVAESSFVTEIPAKLKKAMEKTFPKDEKNSIKSKKFSNRTECRENNDPIVSHLTKS